LGYHLSDEDILQLARSWTSLSDIKISGTERPTNGTKPSLSFASIVALLEGCPSLKWISLSVDVDEVGDPPSYSFDGQGRYRLKEIHFQNSSLAKAEDLALWLCDICPADRVRWSKYDEPLPATKVFEEMKTILRALQRRARVVEAEWRKKIESLNAEK
jgi:hypothetical protein